MQELEALHKVFEEENKAAMNSNGNYDAWLDLKKVLLQVHKEFKNFAHTFLSVDPNDDTDWRNCIRVCPYQDCQKVWVKTEGCNGKTTCGNRGAQEDNSGGSSVLKYCWKKINGVFCPERPEEKPRTGKAEKYIATRTAVPQGCGREIIWSDMAIYPVYDKMGEWMSIKDIENVIAGINSDP